MEEVVEQTTPQKKTKGAAGIITTIIILVISRFVGGQIGELTANNFQENSVRRDMDRYIEKMQDYEPGVNSEDGYASEFWNFRIQNDENWIPCEEDDLSALNERTKAEGKKSATDSLREEGASEDIIKKYEESMYYSAETGYKYQSGDDVGIVYMSVYSMYGAKSVNDDELEEELLNGFSESMTESKTGSGLLRGEMCKYAEGVCSTEDGSIGMRVYAEKRDEMIMMLQIMYPEDNPGVLEAIEKKVTTY